MENVSTYRIDEIKYNIDTAIQKAMLKNNKENWSILLEVQSYLYEEFDLE